MATEEKRKTGPIAVNRKARRNYFVLEKKEAGIALLGSEVKSIRTAQVDLSNGFVTVEKGELILRNVHIKPYEYAHQFSHEARRPRHLLLHQKEIIRFAGKIAQQGLTLIPLTLYLNRRGKIKIELALCRGKQVRDKRESLKRREAKREADRAIGRKIH